MTNYNDGKWHGWNGGECPVHPETTIIAALHDPTDRSEPLSFWFGSEPVEAGDIPDGCWQHLPRNRHVIAFRVIREHREPREWLLEVSPTGEIRATYSTPYDCVINVQKDSELIPVREVREVIE